MLKTFLFIFLGGGLGACTRYALVLLFGSWHSPFLPLATFTANVLGSSLIGIAVIAFGTPVTGGSPSPLWLGTGVGFLGGFTTFSTFTLEWMRMVENGQVLPAVVYPLGTVFSCGLGFLLGIRLARLFLT